jgi:hypothetical protein
VAGERGEPRFLVDEVPGAVHQDERPDAGDDQDHHPLQRPRRERQVEPQGRHPADHFGLHGGVGHRTAPGDRPPDGGCGDQGQQQEGAPSEDADQCGRADGGHEVREHER